MTYWGPCPLGSSLDQRDWCFLSILSLLITSPFFLPEHQFSVSSPFFAHLMFWIFYTMPPLALVANAIAVRDGRSMVLV